MNSNERNKYQEFKDRNLSSVKGKEVTRSQESELNDGVVKGAQAAASMRYRSIVAVAMDLSREYLATGQKKAEVILKSGTVDEARNASARHNLDAQSSTDTSSSPPNVKLKTVVQQLKPKSSPPSSTISSNTGRRRFPVRGDRFTDLQEARDTITSAATSLNGITYHGHAKNPNLFEFRCIGKNSRKRCKARTILYRAEDTKGPWFVHGLMTREVHNHAAHPNFIKDNKWRPQLRPKPISDPSHIFENPIRVDDKSTDESDDEEFRTPASQSLALSPASCDQRSLKIRLAISEENYEEVEGSEKEKDRKCVEGREEDDVEFSYFEKAIVVEASTQTEETQESIYQGEVETQLNLNTITSSSDKQSSPIRPSDPIAPSAPLSKRPRIEIGAHKNLATAQLPTPSTSAITRTPPVKFEVLDEPIRPSNTNTKLSLAQLTAFLSQLNPLLRNKEIAEKLHRKGVDNMTTLLNLLGSSDTSFALFLNGFVGEDELKAFPRTALEISFKDIRDKLGLGSLVASQ